MGGRKKVGKDRRDKYYHLAKEAGYRARSAFKLIQLNKKFEFLQKSRICIDLCAAPGGWMQVASKYMPMSSVIIGVDLVPIKPIRGTTSFVADITTERCRQLLKKELKHAKANVVLHDGAPNVGAAWAQDAFSQSGLVLKSLALACEMLVEGGTFVTKVFRSRDYQNLMWVFNQLFKTVQATKPQSSRNVSAEIFVVCQGYRAPDNIDPKMLDPSFVFQEIDEQLPTSKLDIFKPEKKQRRREGYDDDNPTMHRTISAKQFVASDSYLDLLAAHNAITFKDEDDKEIVNHEATTEEIRLLCEDLKVLGKKDFRTLMKWRVQLRDHYAAQLDDSSEDEDGEAEGSNAEMDSEQEELADMDQMQRELTAAQQAESARKKQRKRKLKKALMQRNTRMAMAVATDVSEITHDANLFDLKAVKNKSALDAMDEGQWDFLDPTLDAIKLRDEGFAAFPLSTKRRPGEMGADGAEGDDEDDEDTLEYMEHQLEQQYQDYLDRKGGKVRRLKVGKKVKHVRVDGEDGGGDADGEGANSDSDVDLEGGDAPLIAKRASEETASQKASMWFSQPQFSGLGDLEDDEEDEEDGEVAASSGNGRAAHKAKRTKRTRTDESMAGDVSFDNDDDDDDDDVANPRLESSDEQFSDSDSDSDSDVLSDDDRGVLNMKKPKTAFSDDADFEVVPPDDPKANKKLLDAAGLAIAQEMINRRKKREMIDASYNRYTFNDDPLPVWFDDEEHQHKQPAIPMTKEMSDEIKAMEREINTRSVKKVLEAKARKKRKMTRKMDKARQQAQMIADNDALTEREKSLQIQKLYRKAAREEKREVKYVVARRATAGKRAHRPRGVTGLYKQVDGRMKKDTRSKLRAEEKKKGKKRKR